MPLPPYTLQRQALADHWGLLLRRYLRFHDVGRACPAATLCHLLGLAAAQRGSVHSTCAALRHAPSDETVRQALRDNLPEEEELLERRLNRALAADLPRGLRRRRQRLAVDLVLVPYHGEPHEDPDEVYRAQPKCGTSRCHGYATAYVVRKGRRYTVALTRVRRGERLHHVARRSSRRAARAGVRPRLLLLDRGFFNVAVVRYLQAARVPFLMAMPLRGRRATDRRGPGGTRVLCRGRRSRLDRYRRKDERGRAASVGVVVLYRPPAGAAKKARPRPGARRRRHEEPYELYAYWGWRPKELAGVRDVYRSRFGVESSYRQMNQARIRTSTRDPRVRYLYVGLARVLRNVWVWVHDAVLSGGRGGRTYPWERLRLATLLGWLRQVAEAVFGVVDSVPAERPPPQPLRAAA